MLAYILRRLMLMVPTLIGVTLLVFFVMAYAPGGFGNFKATLGGGMTQGEDARRQAKLMQRRYALDQPKVAQYGRWLNRVSPIGFQMAGDATFTDEELDRAQAVLADEAFVRRDADLRPAMSLVKNIAAYTGEEPVVIASELEAALQTPSLEGVLGLAAMMDVEKDSFSAGTETIDATLQKLMSREGGPALADAQARMIAEVSLETSGRDRIELTKPTIKAPDLGDSLRSRPVRELILEALPVTLLINFTAIPIIYLLSVLMGVYAARHRGSLLDWGVGASTVALWSMPVMWAGMMLIAWFASAEHPALQWFPSNGLHDLQADQMAFLPSWGEGGFQRGYALDTLWHLLLPVLCTVYGGFAVMSKVMRGALLESLSADYIRTARAKGLSERIVLWRHAFRNSFLPLITMISGILPALFAGSVIVETIFGLQGMGKLGFDAALQKDPNLLMGVVLIASVLKLTAELLRDICYAIADPRVSYD